MVQIGKVGAATRAVEGMLLQHGRRSARQPVGHLLQQAMYTKGFVACGNTAGDVELARKWEQCWGGAGQRRGGPAQKLLPAGWADVLNVVASCRVCSTRREITSH